MADTVQHKKSYKKFFQRKALLDIMRLQLDVSEEFLVKMKLSRLLTPEEYSKVKVRTNLKRLKTNSRTIQCRTRRGIGPWLPMA